MKAVSVFPGNVETRRPSHQGVITLFDEHDGTPLCVMDASHITAMRTAVRPLHACKPSRAHTRVGVDEGDPDG